MCAAIFLGVNPPKVAQMLAAMAGMEEQTSHPFIATSAIIMGGPEKFSANGGFTHLSSLTLISQCTRPLSSFKNGWWLLTYEREWRRDGSRGNDRCCISYIVNLRRTEM